MAFAQAKPTQAKPCIAGSDVAVIARTFEQFSNLATGKSEYCEADIADGWFPVVSALTALKNMTPNEPTSNVDDAFTHKAITESDWWAYFTKRAKSFALPANCQDSVVAYVIPMFGDGKVYLCPLFLESSISSQASVLMHEVRHFDGHGHVSCTRGADAGSRGACDQDILDKGSYSISVQTLVGLARSNLITKEEKPLIESEAVFTAFNRFNVVPKVRVKESVILSNRRGEVYKWIMNDSFSLLGNLAQPARVYVGYENLTIYPLDTTVDAYRYDTTLTKSLESIGLYAKMYNTKTPQERKQFESVTYQATGGLLRSNTISTNCGGDGLIEQDLSPLGQFTKILTLSADEVDSDKTSYLLATTGELFPLSCTKGKTDSIEIGAAQLKFAGNAAEVDELFGLGGKIFALLKTGALVEVQSNGTELAVLNTKMPFDNQNWISASPYSKPEIF